MKTRKNPESQRPPMVRTRIAAAVALLLATAGPACAATRSWDGNGATNRWGEVDTNPLGSQFLNTNWTDNSPIPLPLTGDSLLFAGTRRLDATNNLDGLTIAGITFLQGAGAFTLQGNALTSSGDILNQSSVAQRIGMPVALGASQVWDGGSAGMTFLKGVTLNEHSLTLRNGVVLDHSASALTVADSGGDAALLVQGASRLISTEATLGGRNILGRVTGSIMVTGAGSQWSSTDGFATADGGSGVLTIGQGGVADGRYARLGVGHRVVLGPGSSVSFDGQGTATVSGPGSRWSLADTLDLGVSGTGTLTVLDGGRVETASARLGVEDAGSPTRLRGNGSATIEGAGSRWINSGSVQVGVEGGGTLNIRNGGSIDSANATIGVSQAGSGSVVVEGAGSLWLGSGALVIGEAGTGRLDVRNGGRVTVPNASLGNASTATGMATITGTGSRLEVDGALDIGNLGMGSLRVLDGGAVISARATLGQDGNPANTEASVSGAGASWAVTQRLIVGRSAAATFVVADGATLSSISAAVGYRDVAFLSTPAPGSGLVIIAGAGSRWRNAGPLEIARASTGAVYVENGALLHTGDTVVGITESLAIPGTPFVSRFPGEGSVSVTGPGSRWLIEGVLTLGGNTSTGTLNVSDDGAVTITQALVANGGATINLTGGSLSAAGITLAGSGAFNWTRGTLEITGNAGATVGQGVLPSVFLLDSGKTLAVRETLGIGAGTLLRTGGNLRAGTVSLTGGSIVGAAWNLSEVGTLQGYGTIAATLSSENAHGRLVAAGGTLSAGDFNDANGLRFAGHIEVQEGASLVLQSRDRIALGTDTTLWRGARLVALNGLLLGGAHTLAATGAATVLGTFSNQGAVEGPSAPGEALTFNDTVDGAGSFAGNIRFNQLHSPGNSPAAVRFENVTYTASSTLRIEILGAVPGSGHDQVNVSGTASLDGTLDVRFLDGYQPAAGTSFVVLTFGGRAGRFATLDVSGLDAGLRILETYGAHDLMLSVAAVPEPRQVALMLAGLGCVAAVARRRRGSSQGAAAPRG